MLYRPENLADWTIVDLITALDMKGIRYTPTATRRDLEDLLFEVPIEGPTKESTQTKAGIPLQTLLTELDEQNIYYKPTATRAELEALLTNMIDLPKVAQTVATSQNRNQRVTSKDPNQDHRSTPTTHEKLSSVTSLLKELDAKGIRYTPNASRAELQSLLDETKTPIKSTARIPIKMLLDELIRRDLQFPPNASRTELEALLHESSRLASTSLADVKRQTRRRRRQQQNHPTRTRMSNLLSQSTQFAIHTAKELPRGFAILKHKVVPAQISQTVSRQVKRVGRKVNALLLDNDQDGIREPIWYYSATDSEIPVDSPPKIDQPSRQRINKRVRVPESMNSQRGARVQGANDPLYQLPPRSIDNVLIPGSNAYGQNRRNPPRYASHQSRNSQQPQRRIYSPYRDEKPLQSAFDMDGRDAIDRFGDFVADKAEEVLWGSDKKVWDSNKEQRPKKASKARYWKDRLAEQFDYALGLHDDGQYYNNWEEELKREKKGKKSKPKWQTNRSKKGFTRSNGDVPVWEEEGNLVSLLFGRLPSGGQLSLERFMDIKIGSKFLLINIVRSLFKGTLMIASYTCRWASVRGALPQPIVVMGVTTAALCARPKHKLSMVILTLLALRTVGELLHGYANDGWEDIDFSDTNEDEVDIRVSGDATLSHSGKETWDEETWEGDGL